MKYLRQEVKKAIINANLLYTILALILVYFIGMFVEPVRSAIKLYFSKATDITIDMRNHMICNSFNKITLFEFAVYAAPFLMPVIFSFPYANSYFLERKSGYSKFLIVRGNYKDYIISKVLSNWISVIVSVIISNLVLFTFISVINSGNQYRSIFLPDTQFLSNLFNNNFNLYFLIYTILIGLVAICISNISMLSTIIFDNTVSGYIVPFLFYVLSEFWIKPLKLLGIREDSVIITLLFNRAHNISFWNIVLVDLIIIVASTVAIYYNTVMSKINE
ncbi:hypothetical protein [Thermobrachium celere]|uniref:hypothetical protein n=1 Tax=Thermobrachium celere TaxID=53422 RepID=UPI001943C68A|nr:hypothetical protein [Thermobrachium celere]GFR34918.1 hypothetical protein TCEA9_07300 [Thermobrachium celere]